MRVAFFVALIIPFISFERVLSKNPDVGIRFEQGLSWKEILAKAKSEDKYIFMDCYTTWCGPCRYMRQNVFQTNLAGKYFNEHFINIEVQLDSTNVDDAEIKNWYKDARKIMNKYRVSEFPTYLFFSPEGEAVHRIVGADRDINNFIGKASNSVTEGKQYYAIIGCYKQHLSDSLFLRNAIPVALAAKDESNTAAIENAYIDCLKDPLTKGNLAFIYRLTKSIKDKGFGLFLNNISIIDSIMQSNDFAELKLRNIISKEKVASLFENKLTIHWSDFSAQLEKSYPMLGVQLIIAAKAEFENNVRIREIRPFYDNDTTIVDWDKITQQIKDRYPGFDADRLLSDQKRRYYAFKKQVPEYEKAVLAYVNKYGKDSEEDLNNIAFEVFSLSDNQELLGTALKWTRQVITKNPNDMDAIDTYANLLYKTGKKEDAIVWENRAFSMAKSQNDMKEFKETIEKMKNGERTW
jgi:thiol-disulfide isomerase/thioredoxin